MANNSSSNDPSARQDVARIDMIDGSGAKNLSVRNGKKFLDDRLAELDRIFEFSETLEVFPSEGALAMKLAMDEAFGWSTSTHTNKGPFGSPTPPEIQTIRRPGMEPVEIIVGDIVTPELDGGHINISGYVKPGTSVPVTKVSGYVRFADRPLIEGVMERARELSKLPENRIYANQAIQIDFRWIDDDRPFVFGQDDPSFMDVSDSPEPILNKGIKSAIDRFILGPIRNYATLKDRGIAFRRGSLLAGRYGGGKTMLTRFVAKECVDNDITFVYCPHPKHIAHALELARLYQPCVVFSEDVDRAMSYRDRQEDDRSEKDDIVLNAIDGIQGKSSDVALVLTTNHIEHLPESLLRPGRLDLVVHMEYPDGDSASKLMGIYGGAELSVTDEELLELGHSLAGQSPAVIREIMEKSRLSALIDGRESICSVDIVAARSMMQGHIELLDQRRRSSENNEPKSDIEKAAAILAESIESSEFSLTPETEPFMGDYGPMDLEDSITSRD